ncbi:MAG: HAD-IIB family hydrolase [Actinobacteria bacterium]|nr:HAD-IIB family hydrolase [Actinomycetota bacterium]
MLATDLDGTLLLPDATVSARTLSALERARVEALTITLVTGRPPRWLAPILHQTGWHGLAVAANGAVLIDLSTKTVEQTFPIPDDSLREVISVIRALLPGTAFAVEHVRAGSAVPIVDPLSPAAVREQLAGDEPPAFGYEAGFRPHLLTLPPELQTRSVDELIAPGDVIKLLARGPQDHPDHPDLVAQQIADELAGVVTVTHSTSGSVLLEMSKAGVSKASGLEWLATRHGIDQIDVVAVGDMPNDLPMLAWAGQGFGVTNAHQLVLDSVGPARVVPSNVDDGVAHLIDRLLAEGT